MTKSLLDQARKAFQTAQNSQDGAEVYASLKSALALYERAIMAYQKKSQRTQPSPDVNPLEIMVQELGSVWCFSGNLCMVVGRDETAAQCYTQAIEMLPENLKADALTGRAAIKKRRKDFPGAIADVNLVLMVAPEREDECRYNLGLIEIDKEDYALAAVELQRAIKRNPGLAIAHAHLGDVYRSLGDVVRAKFHYERALQLVEAKADKLDMRDYRGAIRAENGLIGHFSQERKPRFAQEALSRGLLSLQEIYSLTHIKGEGVGTMYPLRKLH